MRTLRTVASLPFWWLAAVLSLLWWLLGRATAFAIDTVLQIGGDSANGNDMLHAALALLEGRCPRCSKAQRQVDDALQKVEVATRSNNEIVEMVNGWRCKCGAGFFDGSTGHTIEGL